MIDMFVKWKDASPDEPILLYGELDDERWEVRKVEIFRDNSKIYASETESHGDIELSYEPIPTLAEINENPQFEACEISQDEFEKVWEARKEC
jgi:hypothetical protein